MFEEGTIVYFDPFYFKNGCTAKPKYFVVLKNISNTSVIASLPTRKDSIPQKYVINSDCGCIELPDINLNCFVISTNIEITKCGKKFDFTTHLYGHQIDDYAIETLSQLYQNEGSDYVVWGKMKTKLFSQLLSCFKSSKAIKRKYKRLLNE
jgi:hypothetical protein